MAVPMEVQFADLPVRMLAREESALREFARMFHQPFYRFFRTQGMSRFAAEDLAASLMTDIPLRLPRYNRRDGVEFDSWVWKIARNASAGWWRKHHETVEIPKGLAAPLEEPVEMAPGAADPVLGALHEALASLSGIDRQIIELRDLGEARKFKEIAELLGVELNAAKTRHSRARARLKRILGADPRVRASIERRSN